MACAPGTYGPSPEGKCYDVSATAIFNSEENYLSCLFAGWHTAIINSAEETAFYIAEIAADEARLGVYYDDDEASWIWVASNEDVIYTNWDTGEPAAGNRCAEVNSNGKWKATSCVVDKRTLCISCLAGGDSCLLNGDVAESTDTQPYPSVANGPSGAISVPLNGEILLYHQFIDPSTGTESFHRYMDLAFVEADEDIHRAALVSVSSLPSSLPHSLSLFSLVLSGRKLVFRSHCFDLYALF